eukprot:scaffold2094_cov146-Amphora_coffeaeformis.AAC.4
MPNGVVSILTSWVLLLLIVSPTEAFSPSHPFSSSCSSSRRHATKEEESRIMGVAASLGQLLFQNDTQLEKSKLSRKGKKELAIQWRKVTDTFAASVLDPSYIDYPIRSTTVKAAKQYVPSNPDSKCLMPTTHKHLGGAYDPTDGVIYGVPANSRAVLCLKPVYDDAKQKVVDYQMETIPIPAWIADTKMKWLRGIVHGGYLWAIPSWASAVLCVDLDAYHGRRPADGDIVKLLPLPAEHPDDMIWQWHGAGLNKEKTAIYCIPANAQQVLKVDIKTKTTSLIPIDFDPAQYPNFRLDLGNKWYGGILGDDNAVYGICYRSCAVLRIDCDTDTAALVGPDYGCAGFNWHGGIKVNGKIYAHPSHAPDTVLVIDTNRRGVCSELPIKRASYDKDDRKNFKWLGGAVGRDGNIYCPPCDTSAGLKIDTKTDECTTFGFSGTQKNKWQGGVLGRDGCIYCIPATGQHVLRIATFDGIKGDNPMQLLGDLPAHKDKWQGGACGLDGSLYFIPENGYRVLKVTPPESPPKIVDGKLPEGDVKLELL